MRVQEHFSFFKKKRKKERERRREKFSHSLGKKATDSLILPRNLWLFSRVGSSRWEGRPCWAAAWAGLPPPRHPPLLCSPSGFGLIAGASRRPAAGFSRARKVGGGGGCRGWLGPLPLCPFGRLLRRLQDEHFSPLPQCLYSCFLSFLLPSEEPLASSWQVAGAPPQYFTVRHGAWLSCGSRTPTLHAFIRREPTGGVALSVPATSCSDCRALNYLVQPQHSG